MLLCPEQRILGLRNRTLDSFSLTLAWLVPADSHLLRVPDALVGVEAGPGPPLLPQAAGEAAGAPGRTGFNAGGQKGRGPKAEGEASNVLTLIHLAASIPGTIKQASNYLLLSCGGSTLV